MRPLGRMRAAVLVVTSGVLVPVCVSQETAAGIVLQANHTQLANASVSSGASVFSGDLLVTDEQGQVQVQVGRVKVVLQPSSSLRLFRSGTQAVAELERGTMNYATAGTGEELVIYALDVRLVPLRSAPTAGQVTVVSRCEVRATTQTATLTSLLARKPRRSTKLRPTPSALTLASSITIPGSRSPPITPISTPTPPITAPTPTAPAASRTHPAKHRILPSAVISRSRPRSSPVVSPA